MKKNKLFLFLLSFVYCGLSAQVKNTMEGFSNKKIKSYFIENKGQIKDQNSMPNLEVKYLFCMGNGMNVQLKSNSFSYDTYKEEGKIAPPSAINGSKKPIKDNVNVSFHRVDVELVGANTNPQIIADQPDEVYRNYYTNKISEGGITKVYSYRKITYKGIYPGIDLVFDAKETGKKPFEYTFIVHPGAQADVIKLKYHGANDVKLENDKIRIDVQHGSFTENIPASWVENIQNKVLVNYKKVDENSFAFNIPSYDKNKTLIIDPNPILNWGTYYGGEGYDSPTALDIDKSGNAIFTGWTQSTTLIATSGAFNTSYSGGNDGFLAKFNSDGQLLWATYVGGKEQDIPIDVACDKNGNIFVIANTSSDSIATVSAHQIQKQSLDDAFLTKFNTDGTLIWSTYFGGNKSDDPFQIICDSENNVVISGYTSSTDKIATENAYEPVNNGPEGANQYIAKFTNDGVLLWGTYCGVAREGMFCDKENNVFFLEVKYFWNENNVFISEYHLTKLDPSGNFISTIEIPPLPEGASLTSFKSDNYGNIIYGGSISYDNGSGFLVKHDILNNKMVWTKTGFYPYRMDLDSTGNIFILGGTYGVNKNEIIVTTNAYIDSMVPGKTDFFLSKFKSNGELEWGTYLNTMKDSKIKRGPNGSVYWYGPVAYAPGDTNDAFICTPGAYQTRTIGVDAFLAKFSTCPLPPGDAGIIIGDTNICEGSKQITYSVSAVNLADSLLWILPNGKFVFTTTNSLVVDFDTSFVSGILSVRGVNDCGEGEKSVLHINIIKPFKPAEIIDGLNTVCQGQNEVTYSYSKNYNDKLTAYQWFLPEGASGNSTENTISVNYGKNAISGFVVVKPWSTCGYSDSVAIAIQVNNLPKSVSELSGKSVVCQGENSLLYAIPAIEAADQYQWTFPEGINLSGNISSNEVYAEITKAANSGTITVKGVNTCGYRDSALINLRVNLLPADAGVILGESNVCQGQKQLSYSIDTIGQANSYLWTFPAGFQTMDSSKTILALDASNDAPSGEITVKGLNACGAGTAKSFYINTNILPWPTGDLSGKAVVCEGEKQVEYQILPIENATGYSWIFTDGTIKTTDQYIQYLDFDITSKSGFLTVKPFNACGFRDSAKLNIDVVYLPSSAGIIIGPATLCQGQQDVLYRTAAIKNADTYEWIAPEDVYIPTGSGYEANALFGRKAKSGKIIVSGKNACGNGKSSEFAVTVNPLPSMPVSTVLDPIGSGFNNAITGETWVCQNQKQLTYSIEGTANTNYYKWSLPEGFTGLSTSTSIIVDIDKTAKSGSIMVMGVNNCGEGDAAYLGINVNPLPYLPPYIDGPEQVCAGQKQVGYNTPVYNKSENFIWSISNAKFTGSNTGTEGYTLVDFDTDSASAVISVKGSNFCGIGDSISKQISIEKQPEDATSIIGNTNVCYGSAHVLLSVPSIKNASNYVWNFPSKITGSSTVNNIDLNFKNADNSGVISVYGVNGICAGKSAILNYKIVNPLSTPICFVEFDTLTQKNKVAWSTSINTSADSVIVYSEQGLNTWVKIGSSSYISGKFIDFDSNPMSQSYNYKIAILDSCGNQGEVSLNHKTVTLIKSYDQLSNTYGFTWSGYEGIAVTQYKVYGVESNGNAEVLGTVNGNSTMYNYTNPSPKYVIYFVGFETDVCAQANAKRKTNIHTVQSNFVKAVATGIEEMQIAPFKIYPNPVSDNLVIENTANTSSADFEIINSLGEVVFKGNASKRTIISTIEFPAGIYVIKLKIGNNQVFEKFVKQ